MGPERAKLLIADCHEDTLIALQKMLEDAGFDTMAVWTIEELLNAIRTQAFDLVLINEYMPGGCCDDFLQELGHRHMRCILMLARKLTEAEIIALEQSGVSQFVDKRNFAGILQLVRKMLAPDQRSSVA